MTREQIEGLIAGLVSDDHRQPIDPKAVYRTRDVSLFTEAAAALRAQQERIDALEAAAWPLLEAVELADQRGDLDDLISGDLQFALRATLTGEKP